MLNKIKGLLISMNIKFVEAPREADFQLAYLFNKKLISGIVSEDSDYLVHKCDNLITRLDNEGNALVYSYSDINKIMTFNHLDLIVYSVLCGCDYAKFNKVGPSKALMITIKSKHESFLKMLEIVVLQLLPKEKMMFIKGVLAFLAGYVLDSQEMLWKKDELVDEILLKFDIILDFI